MPFYTYTNALKTLLFVLFCVPAPLHHYIFFIYVMSELIKYIKMKKKTECCHTSIFTVCRFATCLCRRASHGLFALLMLCHPLYWASTKALVLLNLICISLPVGAFNCSVAPNSVCPFSNVKKQSKISLLPPLVKVLGPVPACCGWS